MMTLAVDYLQAMRARVPMRGDARRAALALRRASCARRATRVAPPDRLRLRQAAGPARVHASARAPRPPSAPATIPAGNLAGVPAVCVPNGFGANGLPTSLQLIGRAFSEATLLAIADRYQQATDWHRKRPPAVPA